MQSLDMLFSDSPQHGQAGQKHVTEAHLHPNDTKTCVLRTNGNSLGDGGVVPIEFPDMNDDDRTSEPQGLPEAAPFSTEEDQSGSRPETPKRGGGLSKLLNPRSLFRRGPHPPDPSLTDEVAQPGHEACSAQDPGREDCSGGVPAKDPEVPGTSQDADRTEDDVEDASRALTEKTAEGAEPRRTAGLTKFLTSSLNLRRKKAPSPSAAEEGEDLATEVKGERAWKLLGDWKKTRGAKPTEMQGGEEDSAADSSSKRLGGETVDEDHPEERTAGGWWRPRRARQERASKGGEERAVRGWRGWSSTSALPVETAEQSEKGEDAPQDEGEKTRREEEERTRRAEEEGLVAASRAGPRAGPVFGRQKWPWREQRRGQGVPLLGGGWRLLASASDLAAAPRALAGPWRGRGRGQGGERVERELADLLRESSLEDEGVEEALAEEGCTSVQGLRELPPGRAQAVQQRLRLDPPEQRRLQTLLASAHHAPPPSQPRPLRDRLGLPARVPFLRSPSSTRRPATAPTPDRPPRKLPPLRPGSADAPSSGGLLDALPPTSNVKVDGAEPALEASLTVTASEEEEKAGSGWGF